MGDPPRLAVGAPYEDSTVLEEPLDFETFFETEARTLFRRLCIVTGNSAEAEEVVQDAFLALWERWDRVGRLEDPTGYLYRTAMNVFRERLAEILGAQWHNVDLERKVMRVATTLAYSDGEFTFSTPKTPRARRSVDLPEFVVAFLRRQRAEQNERRMACRDKDLWSEYDVVLDDGIGQPLSPWTVSADFRRVVRELGLPRTRFHDLRHAHATQLLSAGVHVKAVSERLGHSSTSFTMDVYSAVIPSMGRAAADAADQLFGEGGR